MDIVEYLNEKDELEIKEKRLFEVINVIDKECYKLFCEVTDFDLNAYYKADNLYTRLDILTDMLELMSNCYKYLTALEKNSLSYASRRLIIKKMVVLFISLIVSMAYAPAGSIGYLIISSILNASFFKKIELITKRLEILDKLDLYPIGITLGNAANLLEGKMKRLFAMENSKQLSQDLIIANNYIASYLADDLSNEDIEALTPNAKQIIVKMLQKDLNSNSDDMDELLSELRNKNESEIKLTRELN